MFNLLPTNLKEAIKSEYKLRRLTLALFFAVFIEGALLIFLFPTWLVSMSKERGVVLQSQQMADLVNSSTTIPIADVIKTINSKLNIVNTSLQYPKVLPLINTVISQKTDSIFISQFVYTSSASTAAELSIDGVSSTREALVAFVKKLQDTGAFSKVDLPISNLAKDTNIEFSIGLAISNAK